MVLDVFFLVTFLLDFTTVNKSALNSHLCNIIFLPNIFKRNQFMNFVYLLQSKVQVVEGCFKTTQIFHQKARR